MGIKSGLGRRRIPKGRLQIVICGSMVFYSEMLRIKNELQRNDVITIIPEEEGEMIKRLPPDRFAQFKERTGRKYLEHIRHEETFSILVLNHKKHEILDYIGPNTFAEIAVAWENHKGIYLYFDIPETYREELEAWNVVCLNESLARLVDDYKARKKQLEAQSIMWQDRF